MNSLCGTLLGWHQHEFRHEKPCRRCAAARGAWHARDRLRCQPERPLQYAAALTGHEVAEALTSADRARLVTELHAVGLTDVQIAHHTRMTTFTAAEIRSRLGLAPNQAPGATERGVA